MARLGVDYTYTGTIDVRIDEFEDENQFIKRFKHLDVGDIIDLPVKLLDIVDTTIKCKVIRIYDSISKFKSLDKDGERIPRRCLDITFEPIDK